MAIIGIEVEYILKDVNTDKPVCAIPLLHPATKRKPAVINTSGTYHWDCTMAELTTNPTDNPETLMKMYYDVFHSVRDKLPNNIVFSKDACAWFPAEELKIRQANIMGCSPTKNIYGEKKVEGFPGNYRSAGVHVNMDFDGTASDKINMVHMLDAALAIPELLLMPAKIREQVKTRRQFYGRAGEYRKPIFGIEYRALNTVSFDYRFMSYTFGVVDKILNNFNDMFNKIGWNNDLEQIINNCDREAAVAFYTKHKEFFKELPIKTLFKEIPNA